VAFLAHHLGGSITKGTSHGLERLALSVKHLGDTKVGQHEVRFGVSVKVQKVLGLEISVNNVVLVEEIDSKKNLLDSFGGILLGELALFADTVKKLAAGSELRNNVELVLVV
jgi:hypothetical protein